MILVRILYLLCSGIMLWQVFVYAIKLPESYGKTQFIIGAQEKDLYNILGQKNVSEQSSIPAEPDETQVFFSPDEDVQKVLIDLIAQEKLYICMAAFMITDSKIAQALVDAHNRGVPVEVITDQSCLKSPQGKAVWLQDQGIPVYVYMGTTHSSSMSNLMHHKFIIFGRNNDNKSCVTTGSFNFTHSAHKNNQENLVKIEQPRVIKRFKKQFKKLKTRCMQVVKPMTARPANRVFGNVHSKRSVTQKKKKL